MKYVVGCIVLGALAFFVYVAIEVERDKRACASLTAYGERTKQGSLPDCRR